MRAFQTKNNTKMIAENIGLPARPAEAGSEQHSSEQKPQEWSVGDEKYLANSSPFTLYPETRKSQPTTRNLSHGALLCAVRQPRLRGCGGLSAQMVLLFWFARTDTSGSRTSPAGGRAKRFDSTFLQPPASRSPTAGGAVRGRELHVMERAAFEAALVDGFPFRYVASLRDKVPLAATSTSVGECVTAA